MGDRVTTDTEIVRVGGQCLYPRQVVGLKCLFRDRGETIHGVLRDVWHVNGVWRAHIVFEFEGREYVAKRDVSQLAF